LTWPASRYLPAFAGAGFRAIELNGFLGTADFPWNQAAAIHELRRVASDCGIAVYAVHAEGGLGAFRGARTERQAIDACKAFGDLAAELGAAVVTIHAGLALRLAGNGYVGPLMLEIEARDRQDNLPAVLGESARSVEMIRHGLDG
jgi:sugar phosphate isomerase/epimerase